NTFGQPDQRAQSQMNESERARQQHAQPVRIRVEQHLGQQIEEGIKKKNNQQKGQDKPNFLSLQRALQQNDDPSANIKIGDGIADENGPQKIFGILEVSMQHAGGNSSGSHLLADANAAQGKHARFHSRQHERQREANREDEPGEEVPGHF